MTRVALNKPIKVKVGDREVTQDYLEFSDITVNDSIKYLGGSLLGKKMEFIDIARRFYDIDIKDETEAQKETRELDAGLAVGKEFFKIFDDQDIINIVCALSKLSKEVIGQIPFFSLSEMVGEILPFLLPSLTATGKE